MQIAGLDIGTQNIKLLVAETGRGGEFKLLKVLKMPSAGIRKGAIYDLDETVKVLSDAFSLLRKNYRPASRNIYLSVNGPQVSSKTSKGIIAVSRADNEIYKDDIERVIKASQAITLSPNRKIIHTITKEFTVDGVGDIIEPGGLIGSRLEVESVIVDAFAPYLNNLGRLVDLNGGKVGGYILSPLASSRAVLSKKQKELGVVLVDIGASTTGLSVYDEGKLLQVAVFPVGAAHITNDVAVGFKIPVMDAEAVKLNFGYALAKSIGQKESVEYRVETAKEKNLIHKRFLSEIIESRLAEIFDFVNNELKSLGKAGQLPGGAVLVGGGAKLPGVVELAKQNLRLASQIGLAEANFEILDPDYKAELEDPEFVCSAGLLLCGAEYTKKSAVLDLAEWGNPVGSFLKSFLKNLLP